MRIATIIPGPAGPFFEKNSQREQALVAELRWNGHDVLFVPILFPLKSGSRNLPTPEVTPLFGGAVRAYLTHLFPRLCKRLPRGIWALLNTECLRHFAVRRLLKSPKQLTRFLKTALDGHENAQQTSIRELSQWLAQEGPIDIVLLSTPFLLGLAPTLKRTLQIPVACAMNSELEDLALLEGPDAIVLLTKLRSVIAAADGFIATSLFHAKRIQNRLGVPLDATYTIHPGLPSTEDPAPMPAGTPCLGIVASHAAHAHAIRVPSLLTTFYPRFGSQITVRLFASQNPGQSTHVSLGIAEALATYPALRLESANLAPSAPLIALVFLHPNPAPAFDTLVLEALAQGIPVFLPNTGANGEIAGLSDAVTLYSDLPSLVQCIDSFLAFSPEQHQRLREIAHASVEHCFSIPRMAQATTEALQAIVEQNSRPREPWPSRTSSASPHPPRFAP